LLRRRPKLAPEAAATGDASFIVAAVVGDVAAAALAVSFRIRMSCASGGEEVAAATWGASRTARFDTTAGGGTGIKCGRGVVVVATGEKCGDDA
jgi:hypothetical protein